MQLPDPILTCIRTLEEAGFQAYVVGGCVRDACLGLMPQDYDMCTSATPEQTEVVFAGKRLVLAFQPHTYTRTHALFADFVRELKKADHVVLAEIYAARERNTVGISSRDLANKIPGSVYCATLPEVSAVLKSIAQPGDVILTMGAGDIYRAGEAMLR